MFKPLKMSEIGEIVSLLIRGVARRLESRNITLEASGGAINVIAKNSYDPAYGARPIKRYVQRKLETQIARELIQGNVPDGGKIMIENQGNDIVVLS